MPILDGELLRAFVTFSETLNFTRAAAQISLSQPALFERVQRLTDAVGAPLYTRDKRVIELTERGVETAAFAREMLAKAEAFTTGDRRERVTLAAGEGAFLYLLGPALSRCRGEVVPLTLGGPDAVAAVRRGEADVAVGVYDVVPRGLAAMDVVTTPLVAAVSRKHALARRRTVRLEHLAGERLILAPEGRKQRDVVSRAIVGSGGEMGETIEADGWALMLAFVAANLGIAVVNGICKPPPGVALRPIRALGTVTYRALYRTGVEHPARDTLMALVVTSTTK